MTTAPRPRPATARTGLPARTPRRRTVARIAALLAASVTLAVGLLLAFPAAAEARPADAGADTLSVCEQLSFNGNTSSLPAMRWDDASTHLHSRLGGAVWDDVPQKLQRNGYTEQLLAIGNFFWSSAAGFTEKASRFCPLDTAGGVIDRAAGRVGTAIMESSVPPLAILLAVVGFLWRKRRNGGSPRQLFGTVVIVALMGMMVGGATRSTGGGLDGGDFTPGTLSPGWFVTRTDMITSALAAKPAQVLGAVELDDPAGGARDRLSCYAYTTAMKEQYKQLWGSGGPAGTRAASSVPLVISGMWEQSGMVAWRKAQFGGNSYGDYMSCRLLESFAGTPFAASPSAVPGPSESSTRAYMIRAGIPAAQLHAGALAWRPANDPVERDRQMIGWAACRAKGGDLNSGFAFSSPYFVDESHRGDADALCGRFFTDPDWDGDEFDAPVDTADVIRQAGKDPAVVQFINVLHGKDSAGGPVAAFAYALSGVSVFAVFGLVSLAVIVAKLAALALMLTLFAAMTVALFTRDGLDRVFRFAKQYIGLSFYVFASSLVMAVLALITKVCMSIGGSLIAEGGLMATMWAGLSPLLALFVLVALFKKARIPSPFSLKGGLAWGAAAGGAGAAAAMSMGRMRESARQGFGRLSRTIAGPSARTVRGGGYRRSGTGARGGRTSRIVPDGGAATTAAAMTGEVLTNPQRVTSGAGTRAGLVSRWQAVQHGATTTPGALNTDPQQVVEHGIDPDGDLTGTVEDKFTAKKGKLTAADVEQFWNDELDDDTREERRHAAKAAARWQTVGATAAGARRLAASAVAHRRRVLLVGMGALAAPLVVSAGGVAALAGGAAVAAGAAGAGAVYGVNKLRRAHTLRRTTAVQSAQMDALRQHLISRQALRGGAEHACVDGDGEGGTAPHSVAQASAGRDHRQHGKRAATRREGDQIAVSPKAAEAKSARPGVGAQDGEETAAIQVAQSNAEDAAGALDQVVPPGTLPAREP